MALLVLKTKIQTCSQAKRIKNATPLRLHFLGVSDNYRKCDITVHLIAVILAHSSSFLNNIYI